MTTLQKVKGRTFGEQLYIHLLVFIFLEEPKTTRQLVDELAEHGIERHIRTIQRIVHELKKSGFPIVCNDAVGFGNYAVWQWSEATNVIDQLIQAKSSAFLARAA